MRQSYLMQRFVRLLKEYEEAVRLHNERGMHHPNNWEAIDQQYTLAKKKLKDYAKFIVE